MDREKAEALSHPWNFSRPGSEQPDLVSVIPVHSRHYVIFKVPSNPNHFTVLWFILFYKNMCKSPKDLDIEIGTYYY